MIRNLAFLLLLTPIFSVANTFDHTLAPWDALLGKHVRVSTDGNSSRVDVRPLAYDWRLNDAGR